MKTSNKRAYGLAGLGLVAAVTAIAHGVPVQDSAYAETNNSSSVDISVTVVGEEPTTNITNPSEGQYISGGSFTIRGFYNNITYISYTLEKLDENGAVVETYDLGTDLVADSDTEVASNEISKTVDMSGYDYGSYRLTINSWAYNGFRDQDSIQFYYNSTSIGGDVTVDEDGVVHPETDDRTGDPIIVVDHDTDTEQIEVIVRDEHGNIVLGPIMVDVRPGSDSTAIRLPLSEYDLPAGNYSVEVYAYDENGNRTGIPLNFVMNYAPKQEDGSGIIVPNTGAITIGDLSISRTDFLVSGLVVFGAAAAGGLFILNRKSRKSRK